MKDRILVFIPAYNCEKQITRVLNQFDKNVLQYVEQIIIINNQSIDKTETAVLEYMKKHPELPLLLLRNDKNYGLGGSHKVAFNYAKKFHFDYIIVLHGDDQGNIKDIIKYVKKQLHHNYDSLLGSRFKKKSRLINYSRLRIWGNHIFNIFVSLITGHKLTDLGSGLNMYRVSYLKHDFYMGFPDSLTFNVYMLFYGVYSHSRFAFFPLTWREADQISNAKFIRQSMEIFKLSAWYILDKAKLFNSKDSDRTRMNYTYQIIADYRKEDLR